MYKLVDDKPVDSSLQDKIDRLFRRVSRIERLLGIDDGEPAAPKQEGPWYEAKTMSDVVLSILDKSSYLFDDSVVVTYEPAGSYGVLGIAFTLTKDAVSLCPNINRRQVVSFFCALHDTLDETVLEFDARCSSLRTIRLTRVSVDSEQEKPEGHADVFSLAELLRNHLEKNGCWVCLQKDPVENKTCPTQPENPKAQESDACAARVGLLSSRKGKEILIRNSKYAISPTRLAIGKLQKDERGEEYLPVMFYTQGKGRERKAEVRRIYPGYPFTNGMFDKLVESLKIVKFNLKNRK